MFKVNGWWKQCCVVVLFGFIFSFFYTPWNVGGTYLLRNGHNGIVNCVFPSPTPVRSPLPPTVSMFAKCLFCWPAMGRNGRKTVYNPKAGGGGISITTDRSPRGWLTLCILLRLFANATSFTMGPLFYVGITGHQCEAMPWRALLVHLSIWLYWRQTKLFFRIFASCFAIIVSLWIYVNWCLVEKINLQKWNRYNN